MDVLVRLWPQRAHQKEGPNRSLGLVPGMNQALGARLNPLQGTQETG